MRMDVHKQSNAGFWGVPPNNSCNAGSASGFCHSHQKKPKTWQRKSESWVEQEEKKGRSVFVSTWCKAITLGKTDSFVCHKKPCGSLTGKGNDLCTLHLCLFLLM